MKSNLALVIKFKSDILVKSETSASSPSGEEKSRMMNHIGSYQDLVRHKSAKLDVFFSRLTYLLMLSVMVIFLLPTQSMAASISCQSLFVGTDSNQISPPNRPPKTVNRAFTKSLVRRLRISDLHPENLRLEVDDSQLLSDGILNFRLFLDGDHPLTGENQLAHLSTWKANEDGLVLSTHVLPVKTANVGLGSLIYLLAGLIVSENYNGKLVSSTMPSHSAYQMWVRFQAHQYATFNSKTRRFEMDMEKVRTDKNLHTLVEMIRQ